MHRGEAQEREARDPGHPRSMGKQLERNERLIVVKGQDPIEVTLGGFKKDRIRRAGSEHIDARSPGTLHPWLEDLLFFPAQDSPFPGVGIEARESDAGMLDPNPKVNGKGVKILRDAGVNVEVGLLEHQCREINFGYIKRMEKGLPGVMCKIAISLDGRIGTSTKDSRWITGKAARIYAHKLRAEFDAILIGVGTVLADDPMLNVRHIEGNQPLRVIMDSNLRTPLTAKILQNQSNTPTVIFISEQVEDDRIAGFIKLGAKVEKTALDKEGNLSIVEILKHLSVLGVTNIMVEGGAAIFTSFLKEKLVDRLNVVIAPKLIGSDGIPAIKELGISKMSDVEEWNFRTVKRMGEDVLLEIVLNGK